MSAPVFPAETQASASPSRTALIASLVGMNDPRNFVQLLQLVQKRTDLLLPAEEDELQIGLAAQGHVRAPYDYGRRVIASHGIQRDD